MTNQSAESDQTTSGPDRMRFGYADPPYIGQSKRLYGDHPRARRDDPICNERGVPESECPAYCLHGLIIPPGKTVCFICGKPRQEGSEWCVDHTDVPPGVTDA